MSDATLLALFEDIDPAAEAIEKLHEMGVTDENINVISGAPVSHRMLGRPHPHTNVPMLSLGGAVLGLLFGIFLNWGTPHLYTISVGGQYITPIPPGAIIMFEMTMLFAMLATFLGVFLESYFPNYGRLEYAPEVSDGKIGIFFKCAENETKIFMDALSKMGAESIRSVEAQQL